MNGFACIASSSVELDVLAWRSCAQIMATVAPMIEPPTTSPTAAKMQTPTKYTAGPKLRRIESPKSAMAKATTPTIALTPGVSEPSWVSAEVSGPGDPGKGHQVERVGRGGHHAEQGHGRDRERGGQRSFRDCEVHGQCVHGTCLP